MPRFGVSREDPRKARAPIRLVWRQTDAAMESAPARRVPFRMHEKGPKVHIRGVPLMYPPEGCPPLAGRKRHACHSPPRPVFCPDRPRPLDPGRTAKPHYTVPERAGLPSLPGWGTRGGVADPSPVRQPAGSSRRMPRFGASREDPRKAPCAYPFGLGPNGCCHKTPLHSARPDWRTRLAGEGHTGRGR